MKQMNRVVVRKCFWCSTEKLVPQTLKQQRDIWICKECLQAEAQKALVDGEHCIGCGKDMNIMDTNYGTEDQVICLTCFNDLIPGDDAPRDWTDPAGGVHPANESDPASQYE